MKCMSNNASELSEIQYNGDLICTFTALILLQDEKLQFRMGQFSQAMICIHGHNSNQQAS